MSSDERSFTARIGSMLAKLDSLFVPSILVASLVCAVYYLLLSIQKGSRPASNNANKTADTGHDAKPVFIPSRTTHTRIFPRSHSFSYSYLLVGVPVGFRGRFGRLLAVDEETTSSSKQRMLPWSFFRIDSQDHLSRGTDANGLHGKLESYLRSQDKYLASYGSVYLVTAPRFLGYAFNPVSFWYLYDHEDRLKDMILEVNNTFDERRVYFLEASASTGTDADDSERTNFTHAWPKDFHVSPFNSRKGSYSLMSIDPRFHQGIAGVKISNVITMKSSKHHPKLVASIRSTAPCLDPLEASHWMVCKFVMSWWWVGFVTFPRIVREAAKLFFWRRLHVWYRPEVVSSSIGRRATTEESMVAIVFQAFLDHLISSSNEPLSLCYTPATMQDTSPKNFAADPQTRQSTSMNCSSLTLQILTPSFYKGVVLASSPTAFVIACLEPSTPERALIAVNEPESLTLVFERLPSQEAVNRATDSSTKAHQKAEARSVLSKIRWRVLYHLRGRKVSALDTFALTSPTISPGDAEQYRRACAKMLLARYLCFGSVEALNAASWIFCGCLVWLYFKVLGSHLVSLWTMVYLLAISSRHILGRGFQSLSLTSRAIMSMNNVI